MSQETENMYGYASDEVKVSPFVFGLNAGVAFLKKFEWIPNGGKDGAEQEALEIIFDINGTEKSYRKFPVTQAFGKNGEVITDPKSSEFKEAIQSFNAVITHILGCFVSKDALKAALTSRPITSFKEFAQVTAGLLPKDFSSKSLDIFMQYQWKLREGQSRTYLEIPTSMKSGPWLCPAVPAVGSWKEVRKAEPTDTDQNALIYLDDANNKHPFTRYGKYMKGNSAVQQVSEEAAANEAAANNISHQSGGDAPAQGSDAAAGSTASGW